jgi:hypothetical protein
MDDQELVYIPDAVTLDIFDIESINGKMRLEMKRIVLLASDRVHSTWDDNCCTQHHLTRNSQTYVLKENSTLTLNTVHAGFQWSFASKTSYRFDSKLHQASDSGSCYLNCPCMITSNCSGREVEGVYSGV